MKLNKKETDALLATLKARFGQHPARHHGIDWQTVQDRLDANPGKLLSLHAMEATGGEPDVIGRDAKTGEVIFCDCAEESPAGRRSLCFDQEALLSRKENRPADSVMDRVAAMGIELLTESAYRDLQKLGSFDLKTSSWVATPAAIRRLGGALFCDRRYDTVFVYHNGAQSYYAARGFRGLLRV